MHKSSSLKLRRENRIKTIHSSLAIEHNSLSLEQVTAVINGKRILGAPQEIKEVQNAYEAYLFQNERTHSAGITVSNRTSIHVGHRQ